MANEALIVFDQREVQPIEVYPNNWTVVSGQPVARNWKKFEDADLKRISGVWECTPGKFAVDYHVWEFCHFLEGECVLTEQGGMRHVLRAGDAFVLSPGFKGEWEVVKTVRKHYVVQA
jgi:hypothetical protein